MTLEQKNKISQFFMNNFNCYAAHDWNEDDIQVSVTPAMTIESFLVTLEKIEKQGIIKFDEK